MGSQALETVNVMLPRPATPWARARRAGSYGLFYGVPISAALGVLPLCVLTGTQYLLLSSAQTYAASMGWANLVVGWALWSVRIYLGLCLFVIVPLMVLEGATARWRRPGQALRPTEVLAWGFGLSLPLAMLLGLGGVWLLPMLYAAVLIGSPVDLGPGLDFLLWVSCSFSCYLGLVFFAVLPASLLTWIIRTRHPLS